MLKPGPFFIRLTVFSLIVALLFYFAGPYFPAKAVFHHREFIQLLMIAATLLFHYGLVRASRKGNQQFIRYFMGATGVKMLVFMLILVSFGLFYPDRAFSFILNFFLYYLLYTAFEVAVSYKTFSKSTPAVK